MPLKNLIRTNLWMIYYTSLKNMFLHYVPIMLLMVGFCSAHFVCPSIIESHAIHDVSNLASTHNPKTTFILFDIDNTIAAPIFDFGSDQWFSHAMQTTQSPRAVLDFYFAIQQILPLYPIELETPHVIKTLQEQGFTVIGLTMRGYPIVDRTISQLKAMHIDFSSNILANDLELEPASAAIYKQGIIFCNGTDKATILDKFFTITGIYPSVCIFVDDKIKYLTTVKAMLNRHGIGFYGIRYGRCDERVRSFDNAQAAQECKQLLDHYHAMLNTSHTFACAPLNVVP